jgi:hypothetical protein
MMKRTSRSYSCLPDAPRATSRSAWFDLPPGGRASAGTVGRVQVLGHNAFVSLRDGGDEQFAATAHNPLRKSDLGILESGAHFGQAFTTDA